MSAVLIVLIRDRTQQSFGAVVASLRSPRAEFIWIYIDTGQARIAALSTAYSVVLPRFLLFLVLPWRPPCGGWASGRAAARYKLRGLLRIMFRPEKVRLEV